MHSLPAAIPVGIGLQLVGLLLAIGGVQSHRRSVAILLALERLSGAVAPSIVPHEREMASRSFDGGIIADLLGKAGTSAPEPRFRSAESTGAARARPITMVVRLSGM